MSSSLANQPARRSEILELAAEEGHDADIPTSLGRIQDAKEHAQHNTPQDSFGDFDDDVDIEKAAAASGKSSIDRADQSEPENSPQDHPQDDPNLVWWDGPDDPENPMNWSALKRWGSIYIVSALTFLTPLASSMFAPGVPSLMEEFGSTNTLLEGFVVSVYVLGFAFGPLVIAPLSELYGRIPIYHACNVLFIVFSVACASANSLGSFIAFRFFAGVFGASPLTLGGGTIADVTPREQRGTAMAAWMMGPTAGPAIGPIAGGFLTKAKGWRWNFWIVAIFAGAIGVISAILMRETYAPTILARKAERLRKETGNPNLRSKLDSGLRPRELFWFSIVRPTKMLFLSPICFLISLYLAVIYAYLYIMFTTFTPLFRQQYGFGSAIVGLTYLGIGIGCIIGQIYCTWYSNRSYMKHVKAGDAKPEHRLPIMVQGAFLLPIGFFWYGWSADQHAHWIVPIIGTGVIGLGLLLIFMPASTYLVDTFHIYAASAMAASTVLRSLFGAIIPLAGQSMYSALGLGWGNSLLAFIAIAFLPTPFLFLKYGEWLRTKYKVNL